MTRHSQRYRTRNLPFHYLDNGLSFDVDQYTVNGGKLNDLNLAAGEFTIDFAPGSVDSLVSNDEPWDRVKLYGSIEIPEETIEAIFPPEERDEPPAKLYVAVRCHETIYRDNVETEVEFTADGMYEVRIPLDWDEVRGSVELRPYLVRTEDRDTNDNYAGTAYVKVASGQRYEVIVDRWDDDDPPAIDGEEASFSTADYLPDGNKLYYLDFRNEAHPKLWINADHPRIADVLRSKGSVGAEPRMRDVILDQISYGVWSQLIVRAAVAVDRNGEVDYEWQQTVLEAFGPELYDIEDAEEAKHLVREDVREPDGLVRLVNRIDTELQEYLNPREQLINLMEEGVRI